ncbi:MAG: hypothetical protein E7575_00220 [Ruminococcaceae bacterium]|nr:hypothetical protein [Oscillospiraceae bacterium]
MSEQFKWKESMFMMMHDNPTEKVNADYVTKINEYLTAPDTACSKEKSLKLLKKFAGTDFRVFWSEPVDKYLPAVSEGTMKLCEKVYSHDEAISYAKKIISALDPKDLARKFLFGTAHNAPEYRTALACYYFVKNLPSHQFEKKFIATVSEGDVYSDSTCEICKYNSRLSEEAKMQFWHINIDMNNFYFRAAVPFCFNLNTAIVFLEEYQNLPEPDCSVKDYSFFKEIIDLIEALPENAPPSKLRRELKQSALKKMTLEQIDAFIDMLGYLNILHTDDSFGVTACHTNENRMLPALSDRSYYAYPINRWKRKDGIDYGMIKYLFGDIY